MPTALVDVVISIFNHVHEASYLRYFPALHGGAFWNGGEVWALWSDIFLKTFSFVAFDLSLIFSSSSSAPWAFKTRFGERGRCAGYFFQRRFMKAYLSEEMGRLSSNGHRNKVEKPFPKQQ